MKPGRHFAYLTCHRRRAGLWPEGLAPNSPASPQGVWLGLLPLTEQSWGERGPCYHVVNVSPFARRSRVRTTWSSRGLREQKRYRRSIYV